MQQNNEKQHAARNLFLHTDKTRAEIADILDINTKTLYLWVKHGRWQDIKTAARQTPATLLEDVYSHIEAINNKIKDREDRCPTYHEVEMIRKLLAATKHIQKLNLGTYVEVFQELTSFIDAQDHNLGVAVVKLADAYIKGKATPSRYRMSEPVQEVINNLKKVENDEAQEQEAMAVILEKEEKLTESEKHNTIARAIVPPQKYPPMHQLYRPARCRASGSVVNITIIGRIIGYKPLPYLHTPINIGHKQYS